MNKGTLTSGHTSRALQWSIILACSLIGITVIAVATTYARSSASAPDFGASVKTVAGTLFAPGEAITYTIFVSNGGTAKAFGASALDVLPPGMTLNPGGPSASEGQVSSAGSTITWTGALLPGTGAFITIPVTVNTCDWPLTNTATITDPAALNSTAVSAFAREGFEGITDVMTYTFPPAGWEVDVVTVTGAITPAWSQVLSGDNPPASPYHGTAMARFNSYEAKDGSAARLRTRPLRFPAGYTPWLSFWMYRDAGAPGTNDRIQVQVSTDGGATFHDLPGASYARYSNSEGWSQHVISLTAYAGQGNVRIGFLGVSAFGHDMYIDDVGIQYVPVAASFTYQPAQPLVHQPAVFKDSTPGITGQSAKTWDFGDGTALRQGSLVTYTYHAIGSYDVSMLVCGLNVSRTIYVSENPEGIDASFVSSSPTRLGAPTFFTATISSASWPITVSWNFGDGSVVNAVTSAGHLVTSHNYGSLGSYTATLSVTNAAGTLSTTLPVSVFKLTRLLFPVVLNHFPPIPDTPALSPIDNSALNNTYTVTWSAANLGITYVLQEDTHADFSAPVAVLVGPGRSWGATNKPPGTYYYRVMARNVQYSSPWSNVRSVTVRPLGAPVLNPITVDVYGTFDVTWHAVTYAVTYTLEEDSDSLFTHPATLYSGPALSRRSIHHVPGTYYYRVRASNAADVGPWSNIQSVRIALPYDGNWSGTTSQNQGLSFNVTQNAITSLALNFVVGGCTYNSQQYFPVPVGITGNTFTLSRNEATFSYVLTGSFSSPGATSGSISMMAWDTTSTPPCVGTATATWTATKH
jgi:uncharacterized repeat protein (TIGR01451 family)